MSLEELLVDGDVLDRDEAPPRFVLEDGVDEHRRIAVAEAIQRLRDIDRHGAISLSRFGHPAKPSVRAS